MSEDVTAATATDSQARALARAIADVLKEPNIALIYRIITMIGPKRTQAFLRETPELEAKDGLLRKDGKRRTSGGAFFYRVRVNLPAAERKRLWPIGCKRPAVRIVDPTTKPASAPSEAITWEAAKQFIAQALQSIGAAKTVKITLIGRPSKFVPQQSCVVVAMQALYKHPCHQVP
jgi:hypothetical protein